MRLRWIGLLLAIAIAPLCAETRFCNWPVVDLHVEPREQCEVESQVRYGAPVDLLEAGTQGWSRIRMADGYEGWVQSASLYKPPEITTLQYFPEARVQNLFANVYQVPDTTPYPPLMTLPFDSPLLILAGPADQNFRWVQVQLLDRSTGWVHRGDLEMAPRRLTVSEMLQLSRRFEGLPYYWGGTSTFGFDCSGLIQFLYGLAGVDLPRNARQQLAMHGMAPISLDALTPGDLVFFGKTSARIVHVGLYLGEGRFIHAAASGGNPIVQVSTLTDPKWLQIYPYRQAARSIHQSLIKD